MRRATAALVIVWLVWLGGAGLLGARIATDAVDHSSPHPCAIPLHPGVFGTATWRWWPPGEVCAGPRGRVFKTPKTWRSEVAVALGAGLVIVPIATVLVARRRRGGRDSGALDLDDLVRWVDEHDASG